MHTDAFDRFQAKLRSSGRAYADGFQTQDFVGLSDPELVDIREVLIKRSGQGDGVSLRALRYTLPEVDYRVVVESLLVSRGVGDAFSAQLITTLLDIYPCEETWKIAIELLVTGDQSVRRWLLNTLPISTSKGDVRLELVAALSDLVAKETEPSFLIGEIASLLTAKEIVPKSPAYKEYAQRLQSVDKRVRREALTELCGIRN